MFGFTKAFPKKYYGTQNSEIQWSLIINIY